MAIRGRKTIPVTVVLVAAASITVLVARRPPVPEPPVPTDVSGLDPALTEAIEGLATAIRARPREAERWTQLGLVYEAASLPTLAVETYAVAVRLAPDDPRVWYRLANGYDDLGRVDEAIASMERAIAEDDSYAPAHRRLGVWLLDAGAVDAARAAFRNGIAVSGGDAGSWFGLAQIALLEGDAAGSLAIIDERLAGHGDMPSVAHLRARTLTATGRGEEARRVIAEIRGTGSAWADPWNDEVSRHLVGDAALRATAGSLFRAGQPGRAADLYGRLAERHPEDDRLLAMLGMTLAGTGRTQESRVALTRALALNPDSFPAHLYLASIPAQDARSTPADLGQALMHANRATELNPTSRLAFRVKARILARRGASESAVRVYKQAFAVDAHDAAPLVEAGFIECDLARWADARATFELAVEHDPDRADAHVGLATALMELGQVREAERALRQARALPPGDRIRLMAATTRLDDLQAAEGAPRG